MRWRSFSRIMFGSERVACVGNMLYRRLGMLACHLCYGRQRRGPQTRCRGWRSPHRDRRVQLSLKPSPQLIRTGHRTHRPSTADTAAPPYGKRFRPGPAACHRQLCCPQRSSGWSDLSLRRAPSRRPEVTSANRRRWKRPTLRRAPQRACQYPPHGHHPCSRSGIALTELFAVALWRVSHSAAGIVHVDATSPATHGHQAVT